MFILIPAYTATELDEWENDCVSGMKMRERQRWRQRKKQRKKFLIVRIHSMNIMHISYTDYNLLCFHVYFVHFFLGQCFLAKIVSKLIFRIRGLRKMLGWHIQRDDDDANECGMTLPWLNERCDMHLSCISHTHTHARCHTYMYSSFVLMKSCE